MVDKSNPVSVRECARAGIPDTRTTRQLMGSRLAVDKTLEFAIGELWVASNA